MNLQACGSGMLAVVLGLLAQQAPAQPAAFDNLRKTVAVEAFQATETTGGALTAEGMTALLTNALVKDGRFVVVERAALASVSAEQALVQTGAAAPDTAARAGGLIGASAIVRGVVTKYQASAGGNALSLGFAPGLPFGFGNSVGGGATVKNQTATLEIALRLIDTSTGQVVATATGQGAASSTGTDLSLTHTKSGATAGVASFQNTPFGQAGQAAVDKAVEQLAGGMRALPWTALVVETTPTGGIYLNAGADRNVQPGLALVAYRKGRTLTDPGTGVVLDVELQKLGTLRVNAVREKLSTAVLEAGELPVRGDLLRLD